MKRIIVLEDNKFEADDLLDEIEYSFKDYSPGISVEWAESIYSLEDYLFKNSTTIKDEYKNCCLIMDLNLPPDNISDIVPPHERRFTGWYWLREKERLLKHNGIKVFFHSAFIEEFSETHLDIYESYCKSGLVRMVPKTIDNANLINELKKYVFT